MARWWFVRHGESVANAEGWLAGWGDAPLTARGRAQADAIGRLLRDAPFERAWTSDLSRAAETARRALAGRDVPLVHTPELRERDLGAWEGAYRAHLRADGRNEVLLSWDQGPPGGESHLDLVRRVGRFFGTLDPDVPTLIVAHAGVLRATLGALDGMAPDAIGRWRIGNAEVLEREIGAGTWDAVVRGAG